MSKSERVDRALQRRRMRAGRLLLRGVPQAEVARKVAVTRTTVSTWNEQLSAGGLPALKRRPRGRPSGLDAQQKIGLVRLLKDGALAQGFATITAGARSLQRDDDDLLRAMTPVLDSLYAGYADPNRNR